MSLIVVANLENKPPGYYCGHMDNEVGMDSVFVVQEGPVPDPADFITLPTFLTCTIYWDGIQMMHPDAVDSTISGQ